MYALKVLIISCCFALVSCAKKPVETLKIAINPWPGYEYLYLAEHNGYFEQLKLPLELIQLSSLSDVQRAYIAGRVDGMASTLIEAVQATQLSDRPVKVILVPDYSNGGDVVIADKAIANVEGLKGKTVGVELGSLGIYFLHRALTKNGVELGDVTLSNIEQMDAEKSFQEGKMDAYVTYPPMSIALMKQDGVHKIFSSAEIPFEIIDTISMDAAVLDVYPNFVIKLHRAWQMALDFAKENPDEAFRIMAEREGISAEEFSEAVLDLAVLDSAAQAEVFWAAEKLEKSAQDVCQVLVNIKALERPCKTMPDIVYRGELK